MGVGAKEKGQRCRRRGREKERREEKEGKEREKEVRSLFESLGPVIPSQPFPWISLLCKLHSLSHLYILMGILPPAREIFFFIFSKTTLRIDESKL